MNKRSDSIRSMFTTRPQAGLSADNSPPPGQRVTSGSVRSMKESFSGFERENEALRAELARGATIVEIDPELVDPSPVMDRFSGDDAESFEALKASIAERGQEIPVLLREHPGEPGRYQSAYGHRRIRVAKALGRPVKALVRQMSEEDLVVAQGVENSAREDLSFIERAYFALALEEGGFERRVVQEALSVDKAEASKLLTVARAVPRSIIAHIGRAPKIGRGRWQAFADGWENKGAPSRFRRLIMSDAFKAMDTDARFLAALAATQPEAEPAKSGPMRRPVVASSGRRIADFTRSPKETKLVMAPGLEPRFAEFVAQRLPDLYDAFLEASDDETPAPDAS